jgi:hypothetical protein
MLNHIAANGWRSMNQWVLRSHFLSIGPDLPGVNYPEGFQGNYIPIDGAAVARLLRGLLCECWHSCSTADFKISQHEGDLYEPNHTRAH